MHEWQIYKLVVRPNCGSWVTYLGPHRTNAISMSDLHIFVFVVNGSMPSMSLSNSYVGFVLRHVKRRPYDNQVGQ